MVHNNEHGKHPYNNNIKKVKTSTLYCCNCLRVKKLRNGQSRATVSEVSVILSRLRFDSFTQSVPHSPLADNIIVYIIMSQYIT